MTQQFWPGTSLPKSMDNAFSEHLRFPRSSFAGNPAFRSQKYAEPSANSAVMGLSQKADQLAEEFKRRRAAQGRGA